VKFRTRTTMAAVALTVATALTGACGEQTPAGVDYWDDGHCVDASGDGLATCDESSPYEDDSDVPAFILIPGRSGYHPPATGRAVERDRSYLDNRTSGGGSQPKKKTTKKK
jgi:hypothetical protein